MQYIADFLPKLSENTDQMRQLLRIKSEWNWAEREQENFDKTKTKIAEIPCLAFFC